MRRFFIPRKTIGHLPGTLVSDPHEREPAPVTITFLSYGPAGLFVERQSSRFDVDMNFVDTPGVAWLDVDGVHRPEILETIGEHAGLHPLVLEDIQNIYQPPKVEDFDDYIYFVLKMLSWDDNAQQLMAESMSLILGQGYVLSFKEDPGDIFENVRQRLRNGRGRILKTGADYLAYSLIDQVVDNYFLVLENLAEQIEDLEDELVTGPDISTLQAIHNLKRELIFLRKSVWPLREVVTRLERGESHLFQPETQAYLRDVYDHTIHVIETIESFRDMVSGMLDIYLSSVSNRMNEVMKVLTIIATIFIPLTFIVGVYGMNFAYMPELQWRWGYFATWGIMGIIFVGMIIFFKYKKWL